METNTVALICCFFIYISVKPAAIDSLRIGTKWCGAGNESSPQHELGIFKKTDKCCEEHDLCPDNIPANSWKHGLYNKQFFTSSHCNCDDKLYKCLKKANTIISEQTGFNYFNILGEKCFNQTYPVIKCAKKKHCKCVKYIFNTTDKPTYWEWFDTPFY